jgi:glucosamine-phosphate N-acetyltransferase
MNIRPIKRDDLYNGLLETLKEVWWIDYIDETTFNEFNCENNFTYVAEIDGEIVGSATLFIQKKLIRNGGVAGFIEEVVVREKFRGNNIGSELIKVLINKAKELNCYKVILSCYPERVSFYERNGFFNESITMRINL